MSLDVPRFVFASYPTGILAIPPVFRYIIDNACHQLALMYNIGSFTQVPPDCVRDTSAQITFRRFQNGYRAFLEALS